MKKILFVYDKMIIGGTTTSLLSILSLLSPSNYDVDLLLYDDTGVMQKFIPEHINIKTVKKKRFSLLKRLIGFIFSSYLWKFLKNMWTSKCSLKMLFWQMTNDIKARQTELLKDEYDVAIGFMEGWSSCYVTRTKLNARLKYTWLHLDVEDSYLVRDSYAGCYNKADGIFTVSKKCEENFIKWYPEYADKTATIENILSQSVILDKARSEDIPCFYDKNKINLISVCRIVYNHKGLDRGINAFVKLKEMGIDDIHWYVIGKGPDYIDMKEQIEKYQLQDRIFLLGEKINPLSYIMYMDAFFLPSRYEGKPMAITEALMLGKPCLITNYASAKEQIINGTTGIIAENDDESVFDMLYNLSQNKQLISILANNVKKRDFSNGKEFEKIESFIQK